MREEACTSNFASVGGAHPVHPHSLAKKINIYLNEGNRNRPSITAINGWTNMVQTLTS